MDQQPLPEDYVLMGATLDLDGRAGHAWAQHIWGDGVIDDLASVELGPDEVALLVGQVVARTPQLGEADPWPAKVSAWYQPRLF